jgi:hypothetical protein
VNVLLLPRAAAGVGPPRFFSDFTKSESKTGFQDNFERPFRLHVCIIFSHLFFRPDDSSQLLGRNFHSWTISHAASASSRH